MKEIPRGRYLMGLDLSAKVGARYVLVPLGPRDVPLFNRALTLERDELDEFMSARIKADHEARAAKESKDDR